MHATTTHARRSCPCPTGTGADGCHKSHWQISPGRYTVRWNVRGRQKQRAHLPQIVIHDRLAAGKPERLDQLPDPHPRQPRIAPQQLMDLLLERIQLRRRRRPLIPRRDLRSQRQPHRVARKARPPRQLLDRDPTNEMLPAQLRPALHVQHDPSPGLGDMTEPGSKHPRTPPPPPEGVSFQPAKGGQFSTGADIFRDGQLAPKSQKSPANRRVADRVCFTSIPVDCCSYPRVKDVARPPRPFHLLRATAAWGSKASATPASARAAPPRPKEAPDERRARRLLSRGSGTRRTPRRAADSARCEGTSSLRRRWWHPVSSVWKTRRPANRRRPLRGA
jgi:hypothetical protein